MTRRWIEYQRLPDVVRAARNPKGHDDAAIAASIRRFGYTAPVQVDERTGRLVGGHGRLGVVEAAVARGDALPDGLDVDTDGVWLIPVVRGWASTSDAEAEAYLVADNQLTIAGGWVVPDLADMLSRMPDLTGLGFTPVDLSDLMARAEPPEAAPVRPSLADRFGVPPLLRPRHPTGRVAHP